MGKRKSLNVSHIHIYIASSVQFDLSRHMDLQMGGACSAYGGEERRIQSFDGKT